MLLCLSACLPALAQGSLQHAAFHWHHFNVRTSVRTQYDPTPRCYIPNNKTGRQLWAARPPHLLVWAVSKIAFGTVWLSAFPTLVHRHCSYVERLSWDSCTQHAAGSNPGCFWGQRHPVMIPDTVPFNSLKCRRRSTAIDLTSARFCKRCLLQTVPSRKVQWWSLTGAWWQLSKQSCRSATSHTRESWAQRCSRDHGA